MERRKYDLLNVSEDVVAFTKNTKELADRIAYKPIPKNYVYDPWRDMETWQVLTFCGCLVYGSFEDNEELDFDIIKKEIDFTKAIEEFDDDAITQTYLLDLINKIGACDGTDEFDDI